MKSSTVIALFVVVVLALLAGSEGMSLRSRRGLGVELHCRCIQKESRRIGKYIAKIELVFANSHCEETEIIATLKNTCLEVCLDPEAPWVKKVIEKLMPSKTL